MKIPTLTACVAGTLLLAAPPATAQFGGQMPRDGACFYQDANFRGNFFCVAAGDELPGVPSGANDRISSIRVLGRADVTIYKDPRFRGSSRRITSDVRNLDDEGFNDEISSVQVEGGRNSGFGRDRDRDRDRDDRGFGGGFGAGNADRIVRRAYQDILDREPDRDGLRLYRSRIIDDGWTEAQVREALRSSPEFREKSTMTRDKAEAIVRQAYLSVLRREPDAGSRGYVNSVLREGWSQQDVERELRRSPEYRGR